MLIDDERGAAALAAIGDGPGIDGRADEGAVGDLFRELRFQRKSVFRAEQRAAMDEGVAPDDGAWTWEMLGETALDYLIVQGKDLEAMAILLEASVRLDGLPGLARGTGLLADLVEQWWEAGLYPAEDEEDGVDARFQPISGMSGGGSDKDGTLVMPLRRLVLASDGAGGELRFIDRVMAESQITAAQTAKPEQRAQLQREADEAFAAGEGIARRAAGARLRAGVASLSAAEAAWRRTVSFISERTKPRFPAASRVTDELGRMRGWIEGLLRLLPEDGGAEADVAALEGAGNAVAPASSGTAGGPIGGREDALRAVTAAAEFFERFEPLSPIGSALRDIERRAKMTFADLLVELIPDSSSRETFYWRSGIKPPADA